MRCKHAYDVVGRSYNPPRTLDFESASGDGLDIVNRLLSGWTDVSLRCSKCGDVATRQLLGKWTDFDRLRSLIPTPLPSPA